MGIKEKPCVICKVVKDENAYKTKMYKTCLDCQSNKALINETRRKKSNEKTQSLKVAAGFPKRFAFIIFSQNKKIRVEKISDYGIGAAVSWLVTTKKIRLNEKIERVLCNDRFFNKEVASYCLKSPYANLFTNNSKNLIGLK